MTTLKTVESGYPKIRDLQRLLRPRLDLFKINTILKYLERSKRLETDLDGNIIWIREGTEKNQQSLAERADMSKAFLDLFSKRDIRRPAEDDDASDETEQ